MKTAVEEQRINVGGLTTRYFTAGNDGPPLVLLNGVGTSALDWSWVLPTLAATHRVYAPDLPGFGDKGSCQDSMCCRRRMNTIPEQKLVWTATGARTRYTSTDNIGESCYYRTTKRRKGRALSVLQAF